LKHEATETLTGMIKRLGKDSKGNFKLNTQSIVDVVVSSELIKDEDCRLCELLFYLMETILKYVNNTRDMMISLIQTNEVRKLLESPLVRGNVLESLKVFLSTLQEEGDDSTYEKLKSMFLSVLNPHLSDQSFVAVSQCIATITLQMPDQFVNKMLSEFRSGIESSGATTIRISLLIVGEIGAQRSLEGHEGLEEVVLKTFYNPSERVKSTAARALGLLCVGGVGQYIPFILKHLKKGDALEYLLLNSLREAIAESERCHRQEILKQYIGQMCPLLFQSSNSKDEGVRTVVGECLGRLAFIAGNDSVFGQIQNLLQIQTAQKPSEKEYIRATMATAIKFAVQTQQSLPSTIIDTLFSCLNTETEILPRRSLMLCFNTISNTKGELLHSRINDLIDHVYPYCKTNEALIKQFELGPFKHKVDHGLPLRKACFHVMDSLQKVFSHRLDITQYCDHLKFGFNDGNEDVQIMAYGILGQLADNSPQQLVPCLDSLSKQILSGIKVKLKEAKGGGADGERARDVLKVTVKNLYKVMKMPGVDAAIAFVKLYKRVVKTKLLAEMIHEIEAEDS